MSAAILAGVVALLLLVPATALAQARQSTPIERYVAEGLASSHVLASAGREADIAHAERRETARLWLPSISLQARYTRSGGGRTIEFPVGDLLNPAYEALNDLTGTSDFPAIENESFKLLREKEQESKLQFVQPIFYPQIRPATAGRRALARAADANVDRVEGDLVAEITNGYIAYLQAAEAVSIYTAALASLDEAVRVSQSLLESGLATNDAVFRIEAERAAAEQTLAEAEVTRDLAAAAFNTTLARAPNAPIEPMTFGELSAVVRRPDAGAPVDALTDEAISSRPALLQLGASVEAAEAYVAVQRGSYLPTVSLAADYGIQGTGYAFDDEARFRTASLVMQWTLFDGRRRKERVEAARLQQQAFEAQHESARDLVALEVRQSVWRAELADRNISVAERRRESAANAFRLTERRFGEGMATQLDLLDARAALTGAQQSLSITRFDALKRWVDVNRAVGR